MHTEIIIRATRTQNVLDEKGRRIRELTSVVQKRFNFSENDVELYAKKVNNRGLCAIAQAESLHYKLFGGLAVRSYDAASRALLHDVAVPMVPKGVECQQEGPQPVVENVPECS